MAYPHPRRRRRIGRPHTGPAQGGTIIRPRPPSAPTAGLGLQNRLVDWLLDNRVALGIRPACAIEIADWMIGQGLVALDGAGDLRALGADVDLAGCVQIARAAAPYRFDGDVG